MSQSIAGHVLIEVPHTLPPCHSNGMIQHLCILHRTDAVRQEHGSKEISGGSTIRQGQIVSLAAIEMQQNTHSHYSSRQK